MFVIIWCCLNPCSNAVEFVSTLVIKTPFWVNVGGIPNIANKENPKIIIKSQIFQVSLVFIFSSPSI